MHQNRTRSEQAHTTRRQWKNPTEKSTRGRGGLGVGLGSDSRATDRSMYVLSSLYLPLNPAARYLPLYAQCYRRRALSFASQRREDSMPRIELCHDRLPQTPRDPASVTANLVAGYVCCIGECGSLLVCSRAIRVPKPRGQMAPGGGKACPAICVQRPRAGAWGDGTSFDRRHTHTHTVCIETGHGD